MVVVSGVYLASAVIVLVAVFLAVAASRKDSLVVTPRRVWWVASCLFVILLAVAAIAMVTGPFAIHPFTLFGTGSETAASPERTILFSIRIPRIFMAAVVGATLATAGAVFQGLLRNPLADPYILGVSGGAAVGAVCGIIVGIDALPFGVPLLAFAGSLLSIFLVFGVAGKSRQIHSETLLLAGVIVNAFCTAIIMFLISTSAGVRLHGVMFWLMGDLGLADGRQTVFAGLILIAGAILIYRQARALNLLTVGEETALQLGVDVDATKRTLFVVSSLITAAAVSLGGMIGFVGLLVPHLMRMVLGSDYRLLLPACFLFGAAFMTAADTLARTVLAPGELPVGVITALCGAPFFIYLLKKKGVDRCRY